MRKSKIRRSDSVSLQNRGAALDILQAAVRPVFEHLERRQLLTTVYVNNDWDVTSNVGDPALTEGDTVDNHSDYASGPRYVSGLIYGTGTTIGVANAFDSISSAVAYINNNPGSGVDKIHVVTGTYQTQATVNIPNLTIEGDAVGLDPNVGLQLAARPPESVLEASNGSLVITAPGVVIDGFTIQKAISTAASGITVTNGNNVVIRNNILQDNITGVTIAPSGMNTVDNFTVQNNLFASNNRSGTNRGQGLRVVGVSGGVVSNNRFYGHNKNATTPGAVTLVNSANITIGGASNAAANIFDDNSVAVRVQGNTTGLAINHNNFADIGAANANAADVLIQSTNTNVLAGNALSGNEFKGDTQKDFYIDYAGSGEIDASGNYFGLTDGGAGIDPTAATPHPDAQFIIVDKISDGVDIPGRSLVRINPGKVYVTQLSKSTNAGAIQRGVNLAVANDTVHVQDGAAYVEQVTINTNLTLTGQTKAGTIIQSPATLGTSFTTGSVNYKAIITSLAPSVAIENLTVDGAGQGAANNRFTGIGYYNSGGSVQNTDVRDVRESPLSGNQHGYGILSRNDDAAPRTLTVSGNTVSGYQKNGIDIRGTGMTTTISGNTVTGAGVTNVIAQNGIVVINTVADISGNTVSGNAYSGSGSGPNLLVDTQSTGILLLPAASGTVVQNNILDGNDIGLYSTGTGVSITGNTLGNTAANRYAGMAFDEGSATVSGANTIKGGAAGIAVISFSGAATDSSANIMDVSITDADAGLALIDAAPQSGSRPTVTFKGAITDSTTGISVDGGTLTVASGASVTGGTTGLSVIGSASQIAGNSLSNLEFDDQTGDYITLSGGALTGQTIDASSATFDDVSGPTATVAELTAIEDKIFHKIDNGTLGRIDLGANMIVVVPPVTPTASNNAYTVLANALASAENGDTIILDGVFDWTETNAAASWAKGNDGIAGNADDYTLTVSPGLNNVTFTAGALGDAEITGPGDLADANLEGVLVFEGGDNKNWTISNIRFVDFDLSIAFYNGAGGVDAFDGTTIENNYIRIANDRNAVAAPADVNQNIGIHYSFGANQTISGNIIEIPGDGISDPSANLTSNRAAFSNVVGMQSNTSGGGGYDGLQIIDNTVRVLNAQHATNPQRIVGIWDNGHAHSSNITISGNDFINMDPGNDPTANLQQAFWITSHSGATTTVEYSDNTVSGASVGFKWIGSPEYPGTSFAGKQAVKMSGNQLTNVNTGFLIQSNGVANLTGNTLTNSGAMAGVGTGVDITAGSVVSVNGAADENAISGFLTGVRSSGTLSLADNDASIHGNAVGVLVNGGAATITNNHIYDNGVGIRVTTGGQATIGGNDFNDASDNDTDLEITPTAGTVSITAGNEFAGDDYFINNPSTQSFDLTGANAQSFEGLNAATLADAFDIEDKIYHAPDSGSAGLVRINTGQVYVTTNGTGLNDETIQAAINAAAAGDTVNLEAGTYSENLTIGKAIKLIGSGAVTLQPSTAGNVITINGSGFGADESVTIDNVDFDGLSGLGDVGVQVLSTASFDNLTISNGNFSGFDYQGVGVFGNATTGLSVQDVDLTNLTFSNNGLDGGGGTGDVQIYEYNGDATLTDLTLVGSATASTGARLGIQFRGVGSGSGAGVLPMGNITLNDVDISGNYRTQFLGLQRYSDVTSLSMTDVKLGGATSKVTGTFGALLRFDAVGTGTLAGAASVNLGNTHFRGLSNASAQPTFLEFAPDNTFTFLRADATGTRFDLSSGSNIDAADLTLSQAFEVEDRILDYTKNLTGGTFKGWAEIQNGKAFVTATVLGPINGNVISRAIEMVDTAGTVRVAPGAYDQDVLIARNDIRLSGDGAATTTLRGVSGGDGATVRISANNVEVSGFTITRNGNTFATWNDGTLNSAGIAIQGQAFTGSVIHDNRITGNRTAIDVNHSNGHTIRNNVIDDNRTGLVFRNQTDNLLVTENAITNNWTVGVLFLDASGGTNSPLQQAVGSNFTNNNISGNWYGQIVDRQVGGSLPAAGSNVKNFSGNWFGTSSPVISTANSAEPGYAAQIPVAFGGTAVAPGGQPDILGAASANFDITPYLEVGTDTDVETTLGRGTYGFQGSTNTVIVTAQLAQSGSTGRIQEGIDTVANNGTVRIRAGSYSGNVSTAGKSVSLSPGASPGQVTINGDLTLDANDTLLMEVDGADPGSELDNFIVNGAVDLGGAALNLDFNSVPAAGEYTIIDNDGSDLVVGTFSQSTFTVNGADITVLYNVGSGGNNVVLSVAGVAESWVDDNWTITTDIGPTGLSLGDTVEDGSVTGKIFGVTAFDSIQDAIDATTTKVNVLAGAYTENLTIDHSLELAGPNAGVNGYDTRSAEAVITAVTAGNSMIEVDAANVQISGFTIQGINDVNRGIRVNGFDDVTISSNIIQSIEGRAIQYNGGATGNVGGVVSGNWIQNLSAGFGETYGVLAFDASYVSVTNNKMTGVDVGVFEQYFYQPNGVGNAANTISGNDITATLLGYGTNERAAVAATTSLTGNTFTITGGTGSMGVQLFNIYKNDGITLTNNTITGADIGIYAFVSGGSVDVDGGSITSTSGTTGVQITNYLADYSYAATGDGEISLTDVEISGFDTGVFVEDSSSGAFEVHANIGAAGQPSDANDIHDNGVGILVSGADASADLNSNVGSIHGNVTGVEVNGGSASIVGNHIYDNTTGIRIKNAGSATVQDNDFEGNPGADNGTDLELAASGATLTGGLTGNTFAGSNFYINNGTATPVNAISNTFNTANAVEASGFRIEDRVYHAVDDLTKGLVRWDAGDLFVTAPGGGSTDSSIQNAITAADSGDTVNVEAGTYSEQLTINKAIAIDGQGSGPTPVVTLSAPGGGPLVSITSTTATDDVSLQDIAFAGGGVASEGIRVAASANFDKLTVNRGSMSGFTYDAVAVNGNTTTGLSLRDIALSNLTFNNNGTAGTGGTGDISLYSYNGDASFTNLTLVGTAISPAAARFAIQVNGVGPSHLPAGDVSFNNVDVSGNYRTQFIGIQRYSDISTLSFTDVALGGVGSDITGSFGAALRFDNVGDLATKGQVNETTVNLGNTYFRGLDSYGGVNFDIEFAPDNTVAWVRADGTNTRWNTTTGSGVNVAAASLTEAQAYEVEDRILHYVEPNHPTHAKPFKGFVEIQNGHAFVTSTFGSKINRAIEMVDTSGIVHIQTGTYVEDVTNGGKTVTLSPGTNAGQISITGTLTLDSNATLKIEAAGATASSYDNIAASGAVNLGSAALDLDVNYSPTSSDVLTLVTGSSVAGQFAGLTQGAAVGSGFRIDYSTGVSVRLVQNTDPIADAGGAYNINEGDGIVLDGSASSDPDAYLGDTIVSYEWDIDNDGQYDDATGVSPSLTWSQLSSLGLDDDGSYTIGLRVTNNNGDIGTDTTTLSIANVVPTIGVSGSNTTDEGATYTVTLGPVVDPGDDTISSYRINWGDGTYNDYTGNPDGAQHTHVYDDDAVPGTGSDPAIISVDLTDDDGTFANAGSKNITITNLAPTATLGNSGPVPEGTSGTVSFSGQDDASSADEGILRYAFDWNNDGDFIDANEIGGDGTFANGSINAVASIPSNMITDGATSFVVHGRIMDDDGGVTDYTTSVTVADVAPTIVLSGNSSVNEGDSYTLTVGPIGPAGETARDPITRVRIIWGGGIADTIVDAAHGYAAQIATLNGGGSITLNQSFDDGPGSPAVTQISAIVSNGDGVFAGAGVLPFTVNNVAPYGSLGNGGAVSHGNNGFVEWFGNGDISTADASGLRYSYDFNNDGTWDSGDGTYGGSIIFDSATVPASFLSTPSTTVKSRILDKDGGYLDATTTITVNASTLRVLTLTPTVSGFKIKFSRAIDPSEINLYSSSFGGPAQSPDVVLTGPGGTIKGSLVFNAAHDEIEFIKTGSALVTGAYQVTLASGDVAFQDTVGEDLDGDNNNVAGGNYVQGFNVLNTGRILSVPDFARGPNSSATINLPNTGSLGIPISISDGTNVRDIDFTFSYDPSLLNVTGAVSLVPGWSVTVNNTTPGVLNVSAHGVASDLSGGPQNVVKILASVPNNAPYGAAAALRLTNIIVKTNAPVIIPTFGDTSVQKVAYFGDVNGDRQYVNDPGLISRVVVGLDSGFADLPNVDPAVVADIDGMNGVDGIDASFVAQKGAGMPRAEIPNLPVPLPAFVGGGIDPTFSTTVGATVNASGQTVIPINIDNIENQIGFVVDVAYEPDELVIDEAVLGDLIDAVELNWILLFNPAVEPGLARLFFYRSDSTVSMPAGSGEVAKVTFHAAPGATDGSTQAIDLQGPAATGGVGGYTYTYVDGSLTLDLTGVVAPTATYLYSPASGVPMRIELPFAENVDASFTASDVQLTNLTTSAVVNSGDITVGYGSGNDINLTFNFPYGALADGYYQLTIPAAAVQDSAGNPMLSPVSLQFFFLNGDATRDGRVSTLDFNVLAGNFGATGKQFDHGDFTFDGIVDSIDFGVFAGQYGKSLPTPAPVPAAPSAAVQSSSLFSDQSIEDESEVLDAA